METRLLYRIGNLTGTLEIVEDAEKLKLPLAEEVLTLQSSDLSGAFKVLGVDGPVHHDVYKKVDYTVRLSRI